MLTQTENSEHRADVVVYGDAAGGVTAAVQAARMGKQVILVTQYGHLGGMTASGLGWTDIGNPAILGGLSREFYHRVYRHYQDDAAWVQEGRADYDGECQGFPLVDHGNQLASTFEPKVAEAIFDAMVADAGVQVMRGRLDLSKGVTKEGEAIRRLHLEGGATVAGRMFIDASYEGDLLAAAGVSFVMGRESNAEFAETCNGITGPREGNQLPDGIDPYVVPGDPSSRLLPGVTSELGGGIGEGDDLLQAYCYRMVLTDVAANRLPVPKPDGYDEADYEMLFRTIETGYDGPFFKTTLVPNRKTDANNIGGVSCDLIGGNYGPGWNWATLDHAERERVAAAHRDWQLGLVWTLQNHPRVPESIRTEIAPWGLVKDEFPDNDHWPYNLYVREARRMRSDVVMTENHCRCESPVDDPIGMGAYTLDSHNTQRFVHEGMVKNEGDIQSWLNRKAYGISYRSIVPATGECENLLVPWALSATHIAFGSIRMEPVSMVLGQSAATAACLAIDRDTSVQTIRYKELRTRLLKDGQRLATS
jgi:hypothetical protein